MWKRKFAVVLTTALVLGGGTAAWAATGSGGTDSGSNATHKQADPAKRAAIKNCFTTSGVVKGQEPTDTQRQALKTCLTGLGITWDGHHGSGHHHGSGRTQPRDGRRVNGRPAFHMSDLSTTAPESRDVDPVSCAAGRPAFALSST